jgi:hypothetical protein
MSQTIHGLPGYKAQRCVSPRHVLQHDAGALRLPRGCTIDAAASRDLSNTSDNGVIQAGVMLGRITATGRYAPAIVGVLAAVHDTSVVTTTLTVPATVAAELNRRIGGSGSLTLVGPPTAAGVVNAETVAFTAINTTSGEITITATTNDFAAGSIIAAADGSQLPRLVLGDEYGVRVVDASGNNVDANAASAYAGGLVDVNQLAHYASLDESVQAWVKSQLRAAGVFVFSDAF